MAKFSTPRGLTAFLFTVVSLLVTTVAYLSSVARPPVPASKVSARHFPNVKVAVPFGSNEGLLFTSAQLVNTSFTQSGKSAQGDKIRRQIDGHISW